MPPTVHVSELLLRWEEMHDQGQSVSLEELCADVPELLPELRRQVDALSSLNDLLKSRNRLANTTLKDGGARITVAMLPAASGYQVICELDHGGMGTVYRARDISLNRDVAIKVLRDQFVANDHAKRRFVQEAQITGQLQHPAIPPIHEIGSLSDGRPFLVMKLIKGRTLASHLDTAPSFQDRIQLLPVFEQVCLAVGYAHSRGVVHRDLKPANVMVGAFGEVQVMDWGLAKVLSTSESVDFSSGTVCNPSDIHCETVVSISCNEGTETQSGSVLGTPAFMPPEQAGGKIDGIDARTDVFGLGAILCVIISGEPPYTGKDLHEIQLKALLGRIGDAIERLENSGAESELVTLCKKCLNIDSALRPTDAGEVANVIASFRAEAEQRARQAELDRLSAERELQIAKITAEEHRRRRKITAALAGTLLLLVSSIGLGAWWYQRVETRRVERAAKTEQDFKQALGEAQQLSEKSRGLSDDPPEWVKAAELGLSAAKRAQSVMDSGESAGKISNELSGQLHSITAELTSQLEVATRTQILMRDLDHILEKQTDSLSGEFNKGAALPLYSPAFSKYGIAVEVAPEKEAADKISASPLKTRLLSALDDWALVHPDGNLRERLTHISQLVDADPQGFGHRLREARLKGDTAELKRLALEANVPSLTPINLVHLATGLRQRKEKVAALELLKRAYAEYPNDFWVNHDLGMLLWDDDPLHQEQAIGRFRAALAARPKSVGMYLRLGSVLRTRGQIDDAISLYKRAIELDAAYSPAQNNLGNAFKDKGDFGNAVVAFQKAIELDPKNGFPYASMAQALAMEGHISEAEKSLDKALTLFPKDHPLRSDLLKFKEQCIRLLPLEPLLPDLLSGKTLPGSNPERLGLSEIYVLQGRYLAATRLYTEAFASDAKVADDLKAAHRYNAACVACVAADGKGKDADKLDDRESAKLRKQALIWLQADLAAWRRGEPQQARSTLTHWLHDSDLTSVREPKALRTLPAEEREAWQLFWKEVNDFLRAQPKPQNKS
jgi:serine/threonine protein kinase/Flp pilus assembly protein TadD